MINMEKICKRLEFHEGCKLKPYKCTAGKWTIGIGRCYETNPFTPQELKAIGDYKHGITKNAAIMLLKNDVQKCLDNLNSWIWFHDLDEERKYALIDMCFQLGFDGLKKFKNMLKYMQQHKFESAAYECLNSIYGIQTPTRAKRISHLIKTGIWVEDLKTLKNHS